VKFRLGISTYRTNSSSPLAAVKSCNYLDNLLAFEDAKANGFDEAIRLDERGEVTSACIANVFWLTDGKLHTPSLKTGCLPGTTREFVLENMVCLETETGLESLQNADAIYLTSAGIGVVAVKEFDGRKLVRESPPITALWPKRQA
jgi:branched-subunit amino acid aminotransferase/4-amino-4-deoxychorismate lyase